MIDTVDKTEDEIRDIEEERLVRSMESRTTEQLEKEYVDSEEEAIRIALDSDTATDSECRDFAKAFARRTLENDFYELKDLEFEQRNDEYFDGFQTDDEIRRLAVENELRRSYCLGVERQSEIWSEVFDMRARLGYKLFEIPEQRVA